ncbi:MAG TPA: hypothetical protein V6D20_09090 [Candidatus Obscuribacterales bacterium]
MNSLAVLTFEQEQAIDVYLRKWTDIALSTKSSEPKSYIMDLVQRAYRVLGYSEPQIVFCDSPYEASLMTLNRKGDLSKQAVILIQELAEDLYNTFEPGDEGHNIALNVNLIAQVNELFDFSSQKYIYSICEKMRWWSQLSWKLAFECYFATKDLNLRFQKDLNAPETMFQRYWWLQDFNHTFYEYLAFIDFCLEVLHLKCHDLEKWFCLQKIVQECGWIFSYEDICLICNKPQIINVDSEYRLHSNEQPAIQFVDGFEVYAYHGVPIPKEYIVSGENFCKKEILISLHRHKISEILEICKVGILEFKKEKSHYDVYVSSFKADHLKNKYLLEIVDADSKCIELVKEIDVDTVENLVR